MAANATSTINITAYSITNVISIFFMIVNFKSEGIQDRRPC